MRLGQAAQHRSQGASHQSRHPWPAHSAQRTALGSQRFTGAASPAQRGRPQRDNLVTPERHVVWDGRAQKTASNTGRTIEPWIAASGKHKPWHRTLGEKNRGISSQRIKHSWLNAVDRCPSATPGAMSMVAHLQEVLLHGV